MRIYANKTNITTDESVILTLADVGTLSASVAWGDGFNTVHLSGSEISHTYLVDGEYSITVTGSSPLTLDYNINVGNFILDDTSNIRLIEEELNLPYPEINVPSNDVIDADIINNISAKLYTNWKYLKSSGIVIDTIFPAQDRGWYGTLDGFTGWHTKDEAASDNTLTSNFKGITLSGNYFAIATPTNITINKNDINLTSVFSIPEVTDGVDFENISNITFDNKGRLFVVDDNYIYKFNISIETQEAYCLNKLLVSNIKNRYNKNVSDIIFDDNNLLYVVDSTLNDYTVYDTNLNQKVRIAVPDETPKSLFSYDSYTYLITQSRKIITYDNQYYVVNTQSLTADIPDDETILKIRIENNKQTVYILTDWNIYKYLFEAGKFTLVTNITNFNTDSLKEENFVDLCFDGNYNLFALENNQIDAFDVRSTTTKQLNLTNVPWEETDLILAKDSYINSNSYNTILKRHFDLNYLLLKNINTRIVKLLYPGNFSDRFYFYTSYTNTQNYNPLDFLIGENEKVSYGVINRAIKKLIEIQENILSIIKMDTDSALLTKVRALVLRDIYPVGSIIATERAGNPATWLSFGLWERYAEGLTLVGYNSSGGTFDTLSLTGGAETHTLSANEMPAHTHTGTTNSSGDHTHTLFGETDDLSALSAITQANSTASIYNLYTSPTDTPTLASTALSGAHTHTFTTSSAGSGAAHNNLQPYIVAYYWKRTA